MRKDKTYLGIGLIVGLLFSGLFFYYFAPRYITMKSGDNLIKQDRWSGQSWRFVDNQWKRIIERNRNWEEIDRALIEALDIPQARIDSQSAFGLLRKKHPILSEIGDEDLAERIKLVYSKQILRNLYLDAFLKKQKNKKGE